MQAPYLKYKIMNFIHLSVTEKLQWQKGREIDYHAFHTPRRPLLLHLGTCVDDSSFKLTVTMNHVCVSSYLPSVNLSSMFILPI
jgi:hypothetical protein